MRFTARGASMIGVFRDALPAGKRNFRLAEALSVDGAADVPGADDSGGTIYRVGPPRSPSAGGSVRAAGASDARVTDDSDRVRRLENAASPARARLRSVGVSANMSRLAVRRTLSAIS